MNLSKILLFIIILSQTAFSQFLSTIDTRIKYLLSQMTIDEKISQLHFEAPSIDRLNIPAYNWGSECLHGVCANNVTVFPQSTGLADGFQAEV